ncbi:MAG TPA: prolipoprotein diacylglyceryl transferase [Longimicrobiaceae bacterium]|nr:prolipoprotein diacylglyceryl transferase [Longimicrobiaceae bacterium]
MTVGLAAASLLALVEIPYPRVDPVALDLPGPLDVRWYGLGYLVAFGIGYLLCRRLTRSGFLRLDASHVGDLVFTLVLGVIIGARLGYILFYDFDSFLENPLRLVRIWEGGLSFHGGLVGVVVSAVYFARKHRIPFLHLADALALCTPPGIFAVRLANFINGELFGRVATAKVPWAMRFPTDPTAMRLLGATEAHTMRDRELLIERAYESGQWEAVRSQVPLRHPSQLYEAIGEGLLVGLILWTLYALARRRGWKPAPGLYAGLFLACYGTFRIFIELFRQPDVQFRNPGDDLGTVLGPLTMGQTLSLCMVIAGIVVLVRAWRARTAAPAESAPDPA